MQGRVWTFLREAELTGGESKVGGEAERPLVAFFRAPAFSHVKLGGYDCESGSLTALHFCVSCGSPSETQVWGF